MGRQRARLNTIHGNSSRGGSTPEYRAWRTMKDRCLNPNNRAWSRYGGRGITVCERWKESFPAFFADMGPKSDPSLTLARIKTSGNYEPGNCRWADRVAETRANISASLMGHAVSAETRERMRASRLGWKHTPESIAKMGLAGSANGNFKEAPGYEGVHLRAKNHLRHVTICPQCGSTKRLQVALRHDAPSESIRTVTRGGYPCRYSIAWPPDLGYQRLCAKCHHAYDHS